MKILFFTENLYSGGKERRIVELIKGLLRNSNIEVELVLTRKEIHYREILDTGIKIHYIVRGKLKKDPRLFFKFYSIAKKFQPDIIHVWGNMVAIYAIPAKVGLRLPMINNQITDAPLEVKKGILSHKLTFKFSDLILANSYAGIKTYNVTGEKSSVIYNGFDFNRIANLKDVKTIRERFQITTKYVIGMVASFSNLKDYPTYLKAANNVLNNRKDVTFIAIGSGDNSIYKKYVVPQNINNIVFLEAQKDIESIMNICDLGVLTSHGEGISNALLEFSSLGVPILATNNGGTPEIIKDGNNGFLLRPFDFESLASKIENLLTDENKRKELGYNARLVVENKFGIKKMIDSYLKVYKDICVE